MSEYLYESLLEKHAVAQDERVLEYAFSHCKKAYFEILRMYHPDRFRRECPHERQVFHEDTRQIECLDCKSWGTPLPMGSNWIVQE